ncbi:MAG: hypothetical protein ACK56I_06835, partial [bacterium]
PERDQPLGQVEIELAQLHARLPPGPRPLMPRRAAKDQSGTPLPPPLTAAAAGGRSRETSPASAPRAD